MINVVENNSSIPKWGRLHHHSTHSQRYNLRPMGRRGEGSILENNGSDNSIIPFEDMVIHSDHTSKEFTTLHSNLANGTVLEFFNCNVFVIFKNIDMNNLRNICNVLNLDYKDMKFISEKYLTNKGSSMLPPPSPPWDGGHIWLWMEL